MKHSKNKGNTGKCKGKGKGSIEKVVIKGQVYMDTRDSVVTKINVYMQDIKTYKEEVLQFLSLIDLILYDKSQIYISGESYETTIKPIKEWINKQKLLGIHQDIKLILKNIREKLIIEIYKPSKIMNNKLFLPKTLKNIEISVNGIAQNQPVIIIEDLDSLHIESETIFNLLNYMHKHSVKMSNKNYIKFETLIIKQIDQLIELSNIILNETNKVTSNYTKSISWFKTAWYGSNLGRTSDVVYMHMIELNQQPIKEIEKATEKVEHTIGKLISKINETDEHTSVLGEELNNNLIELRKLMDKQIEQGKVEIEKQK